MDLKQLSLADLKAVEIFFTKQDGSLWKKKCIQRDVDQWCYMFKTYNWNVVEIKITP